MPMQIAQPIPSFQLLLMSIVSYSSLPSCTNPHCDNDSPMGSLYLFSSMYQSFSFQIIGDTLNGTKQMIHIDFCFQNRHNPKVGT